MHHGLESFDSKKGLVVSQIKEDVKNEIEQINKNKKLWWVRDFVIKLPLTLQIIQALLVKVGEETLAISLGFIDRVIDYNEKNIKKTNGEEVIVYRENIIPLIRLNERLDIDNKESKKKFIIIVKIGEKTVGLLVDSLLGQQEIAIKPLGKTLKSLKEYIGATILGNGLVTLILDVAALI